MITDFEVKAAAMAAQRPCLVQFGPHVDRRHAFAFFVAGLSPDDSVLVVRSDDQLWPQPKGFSGTWREINTRGDSTSLRGVGATVVVVLTKENTALYTPVLAPLMRTKVAFYCLGPLEIQPEMLSGVAVHNVCAPRGRIEITSSR